MTPPPAPLTRTQLAGMSWHHRARRQATLRRIITEETRARHATNSPWATLCALLDTALTDAWHANRPRPTRAHREAA